MKNNNKKAKISEWRSAVKKWKKIMNLSDWKIQITYADIYEYADEDSNRGLIAAAFDVYPAEKKATIHVDHNYHFVKGNNFGWNLDTVVIHELTHILLTAYRDMLSERIMNNEGFKQFEENVCDTIADLLYKAKGYKL